MSKDYKKRKIIHPPSNLIKTKTAATNAVCDACFLLSICFYISVIQGCLYPLSTRWHNKTTLRQNLLCWSVAFVLYYNNFTYFDDIKSLVLLRANRHPELSDYDRAVQLHLPSHL